MKAALSVALALLVAACSDSTGIARELRVQTDRSVYALVPGGGTTTPATVHFTVKNTGSTSVVLPTCGETVAADLQQLQGSTWVTISSWICPAFAVYAPFVLAPGETAEGQTTVSEAGRYRLRLVVPGEGDEEQTRIAISGSFQARLQEN